MKGEAQGGVHFSSVLSASSVKHVSAGLFRRFVGISSPIWLQVLRFRVKVVSAGDAQWGHCDLATLGALTPSQFEADRAARGLNECPATVRNNHGVAMAAYYCGRCDLGKICNDGFPSVSFSEVLGDLESAFAQVQTCH